MLVGNKVDLSESSRQVSTEEGGALAEQEGFLFIETSALDATNVDKAFETVFNTIYQNLPKKQKADDNANTNTFNQQGERIQLRPPSIRGRGSLDSQRSYAPNEAKKGGCC